ncbi:MAG: hypothetical protein ABIH11_08680 [Candidatus Altiarchaeota archaeon]
MSVGEFAYNEVFGMPVIVWGGIATLLMICATAAIGFLNARGVRRIPFKYHKPAAVLSLILAFMHALLAVGANMGF